MLWLVSGVAAFNAAYELVLLNRLLADYGSPDIRPPGSGPSGVGSTAPTLVETQFWVDQLAPLDIYASTVGFDGYMRLWWNDPRLRFNGTADGVSVHVLNLKADQRQRIWKPDLYWEKTESVTFPSGASAASGLGEMLTVSAAGDVFWSRQSHFTIRCVFLSSRLNWLPFDTHECHFMYGMYAEDASQVQMRWRRDADAMPNWQHACLADWHVTSFEQVDLLQEYVSANFTYARATLGYSRSPAMWVWSYFVPAMTMVFIAYLGFYIDAEATPARVALGIISILVCLTNFLGVMRELPPTSEPPWLAQFILISLFFNVIALTEQVLMSYSNSTIRWLAEQRAQLESQVSWQRLLLAHRESMMHLFREWDTDGSGKVSRQEFRRGIVRAGFVATKQEINSFFDELDHEGDGALGLYELEMALEAQAAKPENELSMRRAINSLQGAHENVAHAHWAAAGFARAASAMSPSGLSHRPRRTSEGDADVREPPTLSTTQAGISARHQQRPSIELDASAVTLASPASAIGDASVRVVPEVRRRHTATGSCLSADDALPVEASGEACRNGSASRRHLRLSNVPMGPKRANTLASKLLVQQFKMTAAFELDKGWTWRFKVFWLFPLLNRLHTLDHIFRVLFPVGYIAFVVYHCSTVNFGADHFLRLRNSQCYLTSL